MRTTGRRLTATAVLGVGLFIAAPASAQTACPYPFENCPTPPPSSPISGEDGGPSTGETPDGGTVGDGGTGGGGGTGEDGGTGGGGGTIIDNSPVAGSSGGAGSLPFTGGEVTLVALTGLAALGGGAVLVAAGRKRARA